MKNIEEITIGDDHDISVIVADNSNEPIDITGQNIYFTLRRFPGQTPLLDKNSTAHPAYVEITEAPLGEVTIHLSSADTALLTPGRWVYVLKRIASGKTYTIGQNEIWAYRDTDNWGWRDIENYITRMLGAGVITVELTSDQMEECIRAAITEYSRLLPLKLSNSISAPTQGRIDLTPYGYGRGVLFVQPEGTNFLASGFGFPIPMNAMTLSTVSTSQFGRAGEFEEALGYIEMASRVYGADFEWLWEAPYLYVQNMPSGTSKITYVIADTHIVQTIPDVDQEWINKFSLARAKKIVGAYRGKYSQIATPGGGTSMDGSELRQEGSAEETALLQELRMKVPDENFMWG